MAYGAGFKRKRYTQGGSKRYGKRRMYRVFKRARSIRRPSYVLAPRSRPELKVFDTTPGLIDVPNIGIFSGMCIPQTGADYSSRVGRKILMKSLYIRYYCGVKPAFQLTTAVSIAPQIVRIIIFVDYQPNGTLPITLDLLSVSHPTSQLNLANRDRFKVLRDITHVFDAYQMLASNASPAFCRTIECNEIYKKINIETIFNATNGGTVADIQSGALYFFCISSTPSGGTQNQIYLSMRVRYIDN